jgi:CheY-like chemotaxis protein
VAVSGALSGQVTGQTSANPGEAPKRLPRYLPGVAVANGKHEATPSTAISAQTNRVAQAHSEAPQILLVEDNQVNQKVAVAQLSRMGYGVETVVNGREAVEAVERQSYGVGLMDCQMPEMDGFEATRLIRELEKRTGGRTVPIIAMTANAMNGDREACLQAGMNDYLAKPIRADDLQSILQKWLAKSI